MTVEQREIEFRKNVQEVGGTIYTKEMLSRFSNFWSEPDRGKKQKMRFEKEPTWDTKRRLATWARNNFDNIRCFLTDGEKSIAQKRHAFAVSLEPYLEKYGRTILNAFYSYWSQPENKKNPENIRWEGESFWSLEVRLSQWAEREPLKK